MKKMYDLTNFKMINEELRHKFYAKMKTINRAAQSSFSCNDAM